MKIFEWIMIGVILVLVTFIIVSNYSEPKELKCLSLYKDIRELSRTPEMALTDRETLKQQKQQLEQYVENGCSDFPDLGPMYDNFSKISEDISNNQQ